MDSASCSSSVPCSSTTPRLPSLTEMFPELMGSHIAATFPSQERLRPQFVSSKNRCPEWSLKHNTSARSSPSGTDMEEPEGIEKGLVDDCDDWDKRHVCERCGKAFNRPSSLKIHSNTHTGAQPYRCPVPNCNRAFNVNSNMRRHWRTHKLEDIAPSDHSLRPSPPIEAPLSTRFSPKIYPRTCHTRAWTIVHHMSTWARHTHPPHSECPTQTRTLTCRLVHRLRHLLLAQQCGMRTSPAARATSEMSFSVASLLRSFKPEENG
ncbi:hypothetical protein C8R45DRAFT_1023348 [Mycena sanguinolenta]|nr:hypothetical protein C8R45DRAFT_1023348 [Mycena sanguinolenta]